MGLLSNPVQQVRTVAARRLASRANVADAAAVSALAAAIDMTLVTEAEATIAHLQEDGADAATTRFDDAARTVVISQDGEIIDHEGEPPATTTSTLASIQFPNPEPAELAEDTPEEGSAKRRKRRSVEGPDNIAEDLARVVLGLAGGISAPLIRDAIVECCSSADDTLRAAAFLALSQQAELAELEDELKALVVTGLQDASASVRSSCVQMAAAVPEMQVAVRGLLDDVDALVRAAAIATAAGAKDCAVFVVDESPLVRKAALEVVLADPADAAAEPAFAALLDSHWIGSIAQAIERSPQFFERLARTLGEEATSTKTVSVLLQAIAAFKPQRAVA